MVRRQPPKLFNFPCGSIGPLLFSAIYNVIICLAARAGKTKRIPCSDWLPKRALARSGLPALFPKFFGGPRLFCQDGWILAKFFFFPFFLRFYGPRRSRGYKNAKKQIEVNIQPYLIYKLLQNEYLTMELSQKLLKEIVFSNLLSVAVVCPEATMF